MLKTFNKISRLNSYILFGSGALLLECTRHSSNIYVVPVSHLKTGFRGLINIIISVHQKKYLIITILD